MDVTDQILKHHEIYGSSDSSQQSNTAASKSLNYAKGASIQRPIEYGVTVFPTTFRFQDSVGLFGTENVFIKFNVRAIDTGNICIEEPGWECAFIDNSVQEVVPDDPYTFNTNDGPEGQAFVTYKGRVLDDNGLEPDGFYPAGTFNANYLKTGYAYSAYVVNNKTGNQYVDKHLDVVLYDKNRRTTPHELMYISATDTFYLGIHARNTKRLPFDVTVYIGYEIVNAEEEPVTRELASPTLSTAPMVY